MKSASRTPITSTEEINKNEQVIAEKAPTRCMKILASTALKKFIVFVTILLVGGAAGISVLYYFEKKEVTELEQALLPIRDFMIRQNETNSRKSDPEILFEVTQLSDYMTEIKKKSTQTLREINKVIDFLRAGWKPNKGHLYLFTGLVGVSHEKANEDCAERDTTLTVIIDDDEQRFIEETVKHFERTFWIALHKVGDNWEWISGQKPSKTYWATGEPKIPLKSGPLCAEVRSSCLDTLKCWYANLCNEGRKWICQMEPDPNYLD